MGVVFIFLLGSQLRLLVNCSRNHVVRVQRKHVRRLRQTERKNTAALDSALTLHLSIIVYQIQTCHIPLQHKLERNLQISGVCAILISIHQCE